MKHLAITTLATLATTLLPSAEWKAQGGILVEKDSHETTARIYTGYSYSDMPHLGIGWKSSFISDFKNFYRADFTVAYGIDTPIGCLLHPYVASKSAAKTYDDLALSSIGVEVGMNASYAFSNGLSFDCALASYNDLRRGILGKTDVEKLHFLSIQDNHWKISVCPKISYSISEKQSIGISFKPSYDVTSKSWSQEMNSSFVYKF